MQSHKSGTTEVLYTAVASEHGFHAGHGVTHADIRIVVPLKESNLNKLTHADKRTGSRRNRSICGVRQAAE